MPSGGTPHSNAPIVVALGGNALSPPDQRGDIEQQYAQTRRTAQVLAELLERGERLVLTHGNGPQVGSAIRRVELARHEVYGLPLDICVADLQGGMGYMITQCLNNELARRGLDRRAATIVTAVEVADDDPAFEDPTKPVGPFYDADRATYYRCEQGWDLIEIPGKGFRRVVPSPTPLRIVEIDLVRRLVDEGMTIVAAGGGGIPVTRNDELGFVGREAVIDKDLASALLARDLGAGTLLIVTSIEKVAVDFGTPQQRDLDSMTTTEARSLLDQGQFPPGSMGPKIRAALDFLDGSPDSARVVITDIPSMLDALEGRAGTVIRRG